MDEDDFPSNFEKALIKEKLLDGSPFEIKPGPTKNDSKLLYITVVPKNIKYVIKRYEGRFDKSIEQGKIQQFKSDVEQEFNNMKSLEGNNYVVKGLKFYATEVNQDSEIFCYILMEYTGNSLDYYIKKRKYENADVDKWIYQALQALAHSESKRIFHGDLSLANITINEEGDVKIIDFGTSLIIEEGKFSKTTTSFKKKAKGFTEGYLPPEVVQNKEFSFSKTDVYCFAMTFYYLISRNKGIPNFNHLKGNQEDYKKFMEIVNEACKVLTEKSKRIIQISLEYDLSERLCFNELLEYYQNPSSFKKPEEKKVITRENNIKIIAIGDANTGKTTLLRRLAGMEKKYSVPTVCVENYFFSEKIKGHNVTFNCIDTVGTERFRSIMRSHYKGVKVILFLFDAIKKETFDNIRSFWLNEANDHCPKEAIRILLANKIDQSCKYNKEEVLTFTKQEKMEYFEVSALKETGMKELKEYILSQCSKNLQDKESKTDSTKQKGGSSSTGANVKLQDSPSPCPTGGAWCSYC